MSAQLQWTVGKLLLQALKLKSTMFHQYSLLNMGSGRPMCPGGVSYSESSDSDSFVQFVGMCYVHKKVPVDCLSLSFFLPWFNSVYWEIWLLLNNPIFSIFPLVTYFVFPLNTFCLTRQRCPGSRLEALIFQSYQCLWWVDSLHWCRLANS